jgi:hypothetical protein
LPRNSIRVRRGAGKAFRSGSLKRKFGYRGATLSRATARSEQTHDEAAVPLFGSLCLAWSESVALQDPTPARRVPRCPSGCGPARGGAGAAMNTSSWNTTPSPTSAASAASAAASASGPSMKPLINTSPPASSAATIDQTAHPGTLPIVSPEDRR